MSNTLYVANLAPDTGEDDLRAAFGEYGDIESLITQVDEHTQQPVALIDFATEKQTTRAMNGLNGMLLTGHRLAITPLEPDLSKDLTSKQRKTVQEIVEALEESEKVPLRQIETMVRFGGAQFVQGILEEALEIDASDGLMTSDGARRRTKGGVFFYLARYRMSPEMRRIIFNRKGKVPGERYG